MSHHIEDPANALTHHLLVMGICSLVFIQGLFVVLFVYDEFFNGGNVLLRLIAE